MNASTTQLLEALTNARIALSFYRQWMAKNGPPETHGTTEYPFGKDCEREARAAIAKAAGGDA